MLIDMWHSNEPSNSGAIGSGSGSGSSIISSLSGTGENCVNTYFKDGTLNDGDCTSTYQFVICEEFKIPGKFFSTNDF